LTQILTFQRVNHLSNVHLFAVSVHLFAIFCHVTGSGHHFWCWRTIRYDVYQNCVVKTQVCRLDRRARPKRARKISVNRSGQGSSHGGGQRRQQTKRIETSKSPS
jgi:hypothetical protein